MGYKEEFEEIFQSKVTRAGSAELLEWLKTTDFSPRLPVPNSTAPVLAVWCSTVLACIM